MMYGKRFLYSYSEAFFVYGGYFMTPIKFFNFALPFERLSVKMDVSIAEIARTAIDQYLQGGNKSEVIKTSDN